MWTLKYFGHMLGKKVQACAHIQDEFDPHCKDNKLFCPLAPLIETGYKAKEKLQTRFTCPVISSHVREEFVHWLLNTTVSWLLMTGCLVQLWTLFEIL